MVGDERGVKRIHSLIDVSSPSCTAGFWGQGLTICLHRQDVTPSFDDWQFLGRCAAGNSGSPFALSDQGDNTGKDALAVAIR